ncbi:MAG TPA: hypothetical protein VK903_13375, partial [Propionicimonas sp.]|nr:hypothetical protein [Propionicimonas sp.]
MPLVVGGLALTLAACGGPVSSPSAGASSGSSAPTTSSGWDINETPRDQLTGGEFIGSMGYPIATWNVASVDGNDAELTLLESPISPIYYSYTGTGEPVLQTDFLLSADPVVTDGKLVVTMKLNPKAVWNDGKVIGADDW